MTRGGGRADRQPVNAEDRREDGSQADPAAGAADTLCIASDGSARPMREVLEERKRFALTVPKATREAAYRARAGMIAALQSCTCGYPLIRSAVTSEHEEWCIAHRWHVTHGISKP